MLIEISGMQRVGKSTLIEGLTFNYNYYKFPMGTVCKTFDVRPTWELQIAKDISTLELYDQLVHVSDIDDIPTITDRGPLSTIFYSLLFHRQVDSKIEKFVEYLSRYSFWHPVWVHAKNQPIMTREKNDNFDHLQDHLNKNEINIAEAKMMLWLNRYGIAHTVITNDFANSVEDNINSFSSEILEIIGANGEY